ncbi:glycosyltransferase family 4 protein [Faecalicatena sp. AGMB00832]|uniref:Glycosyltransferase family 4 protein n=2 Tax=Faecalicatena faecalis TaxID=2726362 RepID=A0ABS6DBA5_9FIRM|nr:glycosyltransferase family 4 protein [Faecalicatena faecalis]MBU3878774.1 glycosyltransferase family 4 protein [Faecalicatena faecalis]
MPSRTVETTNVSKTERTLKKKLLIYAHYYVPDVASTGQLLKELAEGLLDKFEVTVICVVPSYCGTIDDKYKKHKYFREYIDGVNVLRVRVPEFKKTNKMSRIRNITSYFIRAMIATFKVGRFDYIFSISQPPILGGLLGVWGKWIKHAKYIYNIQDFNPEQIVAIKYSNSKLLIKLLMQLDKFSCRKADKVITVGRDLMETLENRFHNNNKKNNHLPTMVLINNWIDEERIYPLPKNHKKVLEFKKKYGLENKFVIMYSGNLGNYYDLLNIMKVIEKFKPKTKTPPSQQYPNGQEVVFVFVGAGGMMQKMMDYKETHRMDNVVFIPYQDKAEIIYSLNAGDVHWCINAKGIKGVSCPSKYYGIAAVAKPILGVLENGSEIRCLIEESRGGLCCEPKNYNKIEENLRFFIDHAQSTECIEMGLRGYKYLLAHLTKDISIKKYEEEILTC